jgi:hypothetical protein
VAGVLAPTNTPADRVIWIPLHGLQTMSGHDPRATTDVSAVLVQLRASAAGFMLDLMYNKQGNRLTFTYPWARSLPTCSARSPSSDRVLELVPYLVALVAAGSVLASIYNSMSARQRDLAILRSLGARRRMIFGAVVSEVAVIGALGTLAGYGVYFGLLTTVAGVSRTQTGVVLEVWHWQRVLGDLPGRDDRAVRARRGRAGVQGLPDARGGNPGAGVVGGCGARGWTGRASLLPGHKKSGAMKGSARRIRLKSRRSQFSVSSFISNTFPLKRKT